VKFAFVEAEKAQWPVTRMCEVLGVSPSGYYAWRKRPEAARNAEDRRLGVLVQEAHARSRKTYGSPRVHAVLLRQGVKISRKRVIRLMQRHKLNGVSRRTFVRTTESDPGLPVAENILNREFSATRPNEKWVGDVTYLRTPAGWLYLAVLVDRYARRVVGWAVSAVNDRHLALAALNEAIRRRRPPPGLLHHTDQGSPYASSDYRDALDDAGMICSMSRRGNCRDNAPMESWFATLKAELGESFASAAEAKRQLFDYIETFYNRTRLHLANGLVSPADFERDAAA
jgi:transposase InsO family protein